MADHLYEEFAAKFRLENLTVAGDDHWLVSVRPGQVMLGALVVSSVAGHLDLADIDGASGASLGRWFGLSEQVARTHFGAVRVNILCLMMKDPVVHFHILPRYDEPVDRYGLTWKDPDWPGPPVSLTAETPNEVLNAIAADLPPLFQG